jgi:hypothetical protein
MLNIDTLDTIIALVVVILLLSLIVQAIQSFVKKLLRLKSNEIEASLLDLFNAVMRDKATTAAPNAPTSRSTKLLPAAFASLPKVSADATNLLAAVKKELQELGRVNARGYFMVDSLSKSDLLNVIARVAPGKFGVQLNAAVSAFAKLEQVIEAAKQKGLPAEVGVVWAQFEGALTPLKQQYASLRAGDGVAPGLIVADVLSLRDVVFGESLALLGKVSEIAAQQKLTALQADVAAVSSAISNARSALDGALGTFKTRLMETEQWFDTTMQSFEERYHRGMRTYAIVIAALVVIFLNANVFTLYQNIADNQILRADLVAAGPKIAKMQEDIAKREAELDANATPTTRKQLEEQKEELQSLVKTYTDIGFEPISWNGLRTWLDGLFAGPIDEWGRQRLRDVHTLFGWSVMILLLSLGAPFWHDTLESLFGVKNLLRRRNQQQNVEQASGAGNPKV